MMKPPELPGMPADSSAPVVPPPPTRPEQARVARPVRGQVEWEARNLDELLPRDHPARIIWALLERVDLAPFYARMRALIDRPGRPASDPRVLLGLWLLGTVDRVESARHLAKRCQSDDGYRWLRGGVPVNYHTLSDFRVGHRAALERVMTELIATLVRAGLVRVERIAQDGLRVRANAGAGSFRREPTLRAALAAAEELVVRGGRPDGVSAAAGSARQQAAQKRAARERQERLERAIREELPLVQAAKARQKARAGAEAATNVSSPRVSTTDPEARLMKMADGGYRPGYNAQVATDTAQQFVVGISVTNVGSDGGQALPMERQVEERTGLRPGSYLMDGGYVDLGDITALEAAGITVYAPLKSKATEDAAASGPGAPSARGAGSADRSAGEPKHKKRQRGRRHDTPGVAAWRERMGQAQAQAIYRERAANAEWVNAQLRDRFGLRRLMVRGIEKVTCVMLLQVLTHNLLRWYAVAG